MTASPRLSWVALLLAISGPSSAIRDVQAGGPPRNARIARRMLEIFSKLTPAEHDHGLSGRERVVPELMVRGSLKKQIASRLTLSIHTVDIHIRNICDTFHVPDKSSAVANVVQKRLVGPPR